MPKSYWEKRQELTYLAGEKKVSAYYRGLQKAFKQAKREIQSVINDFYMRYAKENKVSYAEAQKLLNKAEIGELQDFIDLVNKNMGKYNLKLVNMSIKARITRYQALEKQIDAILQRLYALEYEYKGKELLKEVYTDAYYRTWFNIDQYHGFHQEFAQINPRTIDELIRYPFNGADFSSRIWKQKDHMLQALTEDITTMLVQGKNPQTLARDFAKRFNTKEYEAYRLLHTESSFVIEQGSLAAYKEDGVEKYQILATLDHKTSEICREQDGEIYETDKATVGVNYPPFHPFCRTTTVPYYEEDEAGTRAARDPKTGKTYYVPSNMKYKDWKKTFVDGGPKDGLNVKKITKTLKEQIQEIKDKIEQKGGIIKESDIKEAGELIQNELQIKRADLKAEIERLEKEYKATGIEEIENQLSKLRAARRGLIDLDEVGLKDMGELNIKYDELMRNKIDLQSKTAELENKLKLIREKYRGTLKENAEELKKKLSEIREVGISSFDVDAHLNKSRSPMRKVVKEAYDYYPTDWVEKSITRGNLTPKKVNRGYYSDLHAEIAISGWTEEGYLRTALHELGHRFERAVPGILEAEKIFYERRTAGEALRWLGGNYRYDEKSRFDKFLNPYMGKDYGGRAYELVSMGFEYAYTNPTKLWEDEDFATWIYGILALY